MISLHDHHDEIVKHKRSAEYKNVKKREPTTEEILQISEALTNIVEVKEIYEKIVNHKPLDPDDFGYVAFATDFVLVKKFPHVDRNSKILRSKARILENYFAGKTLDIFSKQNISIIDYYKSHGKFSE